MAVHPPLVQPEIDKLIELGEELIRCTTKQEAVIRSLEWLIPGGLGSWPDHSVDEWNTLHKLNNSRTRTVNDLNRVIQNLQEILIIKTGER